MERFAVSSNSDVDAEVGSDGGASLASTAKTASATSSPGETDGRAPTKEVQAAARAVNASVTLDVTQARAHTIESSSPPRSPWLGPTIAQASNSDG
eukprot:COSAG01_NODE_853_length_13097_cov_45.939529_5_plen_96_part_00